MVSTTDVRRSYCHKLLSNPVYVGEIGHKGQRYEGQHPAIIDRNIWTQARARLASNTYARHIQLGARDPSLLAGILFDDKGNRLTPTHTNRRGNVTATMRSNQPTAQNVAGRARPTAVGGFQPPRSRTPSLID